MTDSDEFEQEPEDFGEELAEEWLERLRPAFERGFAEGLRGLFGPPTVLETKWGPLEGKLEGNTVRWEVPNGEWVELRSLVDGTVEIYRNDRLVARVGPAEIEPDP